MFTLPLPLPLPLTLQLQARGGCRPRGIVGHDEVGLDRHQAEEERRAELDGARAGRGRSASVVGTERAELDGA